jgi:hypothetical protein
LSAKWDACTAREGTSWHVGTLARGDAKGTWLNFCYFEVFLWYT